MLLSPHSDPNILMRILNYLGPLCVVLALAVARISRSQQSGCLSFPKVAHIMVQAIRLTTVESPHGGAQDPWPSIDYVRGGGLPGISTSRGTTGTKMVMETLNIVAARGGGGSHPSQSKGI